LLLKHSKSVYHYYKEVASESIARKIKENIFIATRQLINHQKSGQIEETLLQFEEGHRYLVNNNYKIVYKKVKEGVLITDVFDIRQDPIKINNPNKITSR
jgi:toxin ParE1/3/4